MLLKEDVCFEVLNFFVNHIDDWISIPVKGNHLQQCALIRVYGHLKPTHRTDVWNLICSMGGSIDIPWVMFDDYNEILHLTKKWGGRARPEKQMSDFREVLARCELKDLGYAGSPFTWCNNSDCDSRIFE